MDMLVKIAALAALSAFTILVILSMFSVASFNRLAKESIRSLTQITNDISEIKIHFTRVSDKTEDALENISSLSKKASDMLDDVTEFKNKAVETMKNLDISMASIKGIAEHLESQTESVSNILKPFNDLSKYLYQKLAPPITETANIISASIKAINTFTGMLSKNRKTEKEN